MHIAVILTIIFMLVLKEVYLQILPTSPCPIIFQYRFDGINWYGRLKLENLPANTQLNLKVSLLVRGKPFTNYLGEIELLTRGKPIDELSVVIYNVKFPLTPVPPKVVSIIVNNNTICFGQQNFGAFVTLIHLEHTRQFSFLQKTDILQPNIDNTNRNNYAPTTNQQQVFQTLHKLCGKIDYNVSKIKNGNDVIRGFWPWLAAIYVNNYTSLTYICSGSIVSQNVVITAAHCFHLYHKRYLTNEVLVFLGRHNLKTWNEDGSIISSLDNIFIHPDYDNNLSSYDADIAILILKTRINFNQYITPVCLWRGTDTIDDLDSNNGIIIGWGLDKFSSLSSTPKLLRIQIVENSECIRADKKYRNIISKRTLCAGGALPSVGYSGGGLMQYRHNKWRLRGIVSASLPVSYKSNKYVIYSDSSKFLDWIYAFII